MSERVFERSRWDWTPARAEFWTREPTQFTLAAVTSILVDVHNSRGYVVQFGWGFDAKDPWRPWPTIYRHLSCDPVDADKHALICIHGVALAGFYFTFGTLDFA